MVTWESRISKNYLEYHIWLHQWLCFYFSFSKRDTSYFSRNLKNPFMFVTRFKPSDFQRREGFHLGYVQEQEAGD